MLGQKAGPPSTAPVSRGAVGQAGAPRGCSAPCRQHLGQDTAVPLPLPVPLAPSTAPQLRSPLAQLLPAPPLLLR